ncbi:DUF2887 domain-containing protein [Acaryochloris marina]|uniref:DUF4351 domain-containing protein n=1 Tax=Acaryochloris marina (strain MBIC 11017) TaxID=329726 RepID=A8ZMN1_ACAM1|nr:DUF2887 domain-containing protein [Acaryochloris marina]ABW32442.1 conserved hypothetical protein [Acaryochloris marina MBIC11017]
MPTPEAVDQTAWFVEVQFQRDPVFYQRFFSEIYLYLNLHPNTIDWQAVVIYPKRSIETDYPHVYRANLNSYQVHRVYLEDLDESVDSLGVGLMQLIVADSGDTATQAQALLSRVQPQEQTNPRFAAIMELIETIVVYKFPQLSREEIESMLGLSELKQTKVYQEALDEGRQEEGQSLILRLLTRRIGDVAPELRSQIRALSLVQIEALGEALPDFKQPADLVNWLQDHRSE